MKILPLFAILFALFPLTDTDIWWHLACGREWVDTWTPVRGPVVNVHEYFQQVVSAVYSLGGAPLLVVFKALLWGAVMALFLRPYRLRAVNGGASGGHAAGVSCGHAAGVSCGHAPGVSCGHAAGVSCAGASCGGLAGAFRGNTVAFLFGVLLLFLFRFQLEIRPVLFSLLFLGVYWNLLPSLLDKLAAPSGERPPVKTVALAAFLLLVQWAWCRFQGLYILGPLFAVLSLIPVVRARRRRAIFPVVFVLLLFLAPFLHEGGTRLFLYPFGLFDRLVGLSESSAVFAKGIAENRSPLTLLLSGENLLASALMLCTAFLAAVRSVYRLVVYRNEFVLNVSLFVTAALALDAERNFVLFLPLLLVALSESKVVGFLSKLRYAKYAVVVVVAAVLGFWCRSLAPYDRGGIAYQRVPVGAAAWMKAHPHEGRLFNDDRAGGYLAFVNPGDPVYIDGRFILKTAEFFSHYLQYAEEPATFLSDADSLGIDRAVFPLRYYARWGTLLGTLGEDSRWEKCYGDGFFMVFCRK